MASVSSNIHFDEDKALAFGECEHPATNHRSVNIGDGSYDHVSLFITISQAIQIRDHFANLVERWDIDIDIDRAEQDDKGRQDEPDTLANLGLCEEDFR